MPHYTIYAKCVVEFESDKTPAQIRNALINIDPSLRKAFKQLWRDQLAKDPSGDTFATGWHFHINQANGDAVLDLDDGLSVDEAE